MRDMAELLVFSGEPERALEYARRAMELEPHHVASFPFALAFALHQTDQFEEAITVLEDALELNPTYMPLPLLLAASYMAVGDQAQAERYAAQALAINPQLRVDVLATRMPFRDPSLWDTRADQLRRLGIPG